MNDPPSLTIFLSSAILNMLAKAIAMEIRDIFRRTEEQKNICLRSATCCNEVSFVLLLLLGRAVNEQTATCSKLVNWLVWEPDFD